MQNLLFFLLPALSFDTAVSLLEGGRSIGCSSIDRGHALDAALKQNFLVLLVSWLCFQQQFQNMGAEDVIDKDTF